MATITRDGNQGVGLARINGVNDAGGAQSLSEAVALLDTRPMAFDLPESLNGATSLTFQGSRDGVTFRNMYDNAGTELTYTVAANRWVIADPTDFAAVSYIKVRAGTAGSPTAQAAGCVIGVITQAL